MIIIFQVAYKCNMFLCVFTKYKKKQQQKTETSKQQQYFRYCEGLFKELIKPFSNK